MAAVILATVSGSSDHTKLGQSQASDAGHPCENLGRQSTLVPPLSSAGTQSGSYPSEAAWKQAMAQWYAGLRAPDPNKPRIDMRHFREWILDLKDLRKRQFLQITRLQERGEFHDEESNKYLGNISLFSETAFNRYDELIAYEAHIPLDKLDEHCSIEQEAEYMWTVDTAQFLIDELEKFQDLPAPTALRVDREPVARIVPAPSGLTVTDPLEETTNIRVRRWNARNVNRLVAKQIIEPKNVGHDAHTNGEVSSVASYKTTFAILAALAFFGASISWSAVFTGARGNLVILAWSSAFFIAAATAAGCMGIIADSDRIDLERDMGPRRSLRAFSLCSALFTLCGIVLLGVATAEVTPSYGAPVNDDYPPSFGKVVGMRAAGWFIVGAVVVEVGIAVRIRAHYHRGPYIW